MAKHERKTYLVTSAQKGGLPNREVLGCFQQYCRVNNAELIIREMSGKIRNSEEEIHPDLEQYVSRSKDQKLNEKIRMKEWQILPQQIIPTTGLARFTATDVSTIFSNPKQFIRVVANSNNTLPKVLMTTGAITHPNYVLSHRVGQIALADHVYGAMVVEIEGDNEYHFRPVTALKNGRVGDLGLKYNDKKDPEDCSLEAMVLGDWHCGDTNDQVRDATFRMITKYNPKLIVLHDFWNGHSVNHHEKDKKNTQVRNYERGRLSLPEEFKLAAKELQALAEVAPNSEIYIVACNHHDFLNRYIESGSYVNDEQNYRVAHQIALAMLDGKNPIGYGLEISGGVPEKVKFLERDQDLKVRGWQLGAHGDQGPNGAKNMSLRALEDSYGKSITGHKHTPAMYRNTIVVGTSSNLRLDYNEGPSGWMNSHALLWGITPSIGTAQLINIVNGDWEKKE